MAGLGTLSVDLLKGQLTANTENKFNSFYKDVTYSTVTDTSFH